MSGADFRYIGQPLPRKEDRRFLIGAGCYIDDIEVPGVLHACFVRSPHAHARIVAIDAEAARAMPGVAAVFTGRDVARWTARHRMAPPIEGLHPVEMDSLPVERVRFHGDPVACVVAADRYLAEDAAEQVLVDYEVLPAVTDLRRALDPEAPRVDETLGSNLVSHQQAGFGDVEARMREAHRVVEARFSQHRQTHVPIETRGCIAVWDAGREHLTFHVGSQVPHPYRGMLAARLRLCRVADHRDLARRGRRLRSEDHAVPRGARGGCDRARTEAPGALAGGPDREPQRLGAGARADLPHARGASRPTAGCWRWSWKSSRTSALTASIPRNYMARVVAMILTGPYRVQDYRYDVKAVLTNKVGAAPMRAPMSITSWVMEGTMDAIARELQLDPMAVRRLNMLETGDLPYRMATGEVLRDITPRETFEAALAAVDYEAFRARQRAARAQGRLLGLGICNVVESTTYGSAFYKSAGIPGSGHEAAWVRIEPSGAVSASVGLGATGQGYETALSQAVAEGLGVHPSAVRILLGHTDIAPYGMGSRGARGGTAGGGVLYLCACDARAKVLAIAAQVLGLAGGGELRMVDGRIERREGDGWSDAGPRACRRGAPGLPRPVGAASRDAAGAGLQPHLRPAADDLFQCNPRLRGRTGSRHGRAAPAALRGGRGLRHRAQPRGRAGPAARRGGDGPLGCAVRAGGLRRKRAEPDGPVVRLPRGHGRRAARLRDHPDAHAQPPHACGHQGHGRGRRDGCDRCRHERRQRCAGAAGVVAERQPLTPVYLRGLLRSGRPGAGKENTT